MPDKTKIPILEMHQITKKFGDLKANDKIDLTVYQGEVHALLGENGAGKSTLMNILYGLLSADSGKILLHGEEVKISKPGDAIQLGIGMVHQHFMLVQPFTITQNIILGNEKTNKFNILDMKTAADKVQQLSQKYSLNVEPEEKIENISVGMQQRVEILKALYRNARILILDEPTAVLTPQEINEFGKIIKNLAEEGKSIILISHKLKEIKQMADRCTIIRKGKMIDVVEVQKVSEAEMAAKMVGKKVNLSIGKKAGNPGEIILNIEHLIVNDNRGFPKVNDLNLEIRRGEILGLAGVDGNGQKELLEAITGLRKVESGRIVLNKLEITNFRPQNIFKNKISYIPQDRQNVGLILEFSIAENLILKSHAEAPFSKKGKLDFNKISLFAEELIERFDIRPYDKTQKVKTLSGGNQQKVIIAREIAHNPDLLIASQPTRGLDVGAIEFVHRELLNFRDNNKAILLVSLELDEIMAISDRIAVMFEGKIVAVLDAKDADPEIIGLLMAGGKRERLSS